MLRRWFLGCVLLVGGCVQNSVKDPSEQTQGPLSIESIAVDQSHPNDAKVSELAIRYINQECHLSPETATSWGVHQYDEKLDDYSLQAHKAHTAKLKELLKRLESVNPNEGLSAAGRTDWDQLRSTLVVQIKNAELRDPLVLLPIIT